MHCESDPAPLAPAAPTLRTATIVRVKPAAAPTAATFDSVTKMPLPLANLLVLLVLVVLLVARSTKWSFEKHPR